MNLFSFNEINVTYSAKGLGPEIKSSRDAFDVMHPNWMDIDYTESFYIILLNRGNRVSMPQPPERNNSPFIQR